VEYSRNRRTQKESDGEGGVREIERGRESSERIEREGNEDTKTERIREGETERLRKME
jgi:hypothetical protein